MVTPGNDADVTPRPGLSSITCAAAAGTAPAGSSRECPCVVVPLLPVPVWW
jgi:hypothetical protein